MLTGIPRRRPPRRPGSGSPGDRSRHLQVTSPALVTGRVTTEKYSRNSRMGHMPCRNTERPWWSQPASWTQKARLPHGGIVNPYPSWLNAGDNSWQMTAARLVGLRSIPALAVLYEGLVQKMWAVNIV